MKKNLPAVRYEPFVSVFEAQVARAQQTIDRLRKMEQPYNVVKEVMEAERLPNDQEIEVAAGFVSVRIVATPADSLEAFEALARRIGERLHAAGLHKDGVPSASYGGLFPWVILTWKGTGAVIQLTIAIPESEMRDVVMTKVTRQSTCSEYVMRRREPLRYRAPAWLRDGPPTPGELARIEAELDEAERRGL